MRILGDQPATALAGAVNLPMLVVIGIKD